MPKPAEIERPRLDFDPQAYDDLAATAAVWLPRTGGYDYEMQASLPADGPAIVAPKHTSMMDVPLVGTVIWQAYGRQMRAPAKRQLYEVPFLGNGIGDFFDRHGGIKLDRKVPIGQQPAGQQIEQALAAGEWVELFGEGTRVRSRQVGEIKKGLAALAIKHGAPIQAVGVAGTRHWYGRKFVVLGEVITPDPDQADPADPRSIIRYARRLTPVVRRAVQAANDDAHRRRAKMPVYIPLARPVKPKPSDEKQT